MATDGNVKSGFVSIIGLPNAGKSSFLNAVLKNKLAITSKKPQTTRKNFKGIYNDNESQIVFVDTPGIHIVKNKLDDYMSKSIKKSVYDVEVILVIVDVMTYEIDDYTKFEYYLKNSDIKKILLINKCDLIDTNKQVYEKDILNKSDDSIKFLEVFFISSLKNRNIKEVIEYIKNELPKEHRYYSEEDLTDEPVKQIVSEIIRQQCLYKLKNEIPHGIAVVVNKMKKSKSKCMNIEADIICEKENHKRIIIGASGNMIKNIGTGSRLSIEKFISSKTNLKLNVLVKHNWRDEKTQLVNFGYDSNLI